MTMQDTTRIASSVSRADAKSKKDGKGPAKGKEGGEKKAKKSMKLKLAVAVVLLLVAGASAKFTVLAPSKATASTAVKAKPAPGPVVAMDELTLNLDAGHFLRLKLSIQTTKGTSAELDLTEGTQATIDEFSNRPVAALTGERARAKAKDDLLKKLQQLYPKKILDIFYTEFVMQ